MNGRRRENAKTAKTAERANVKKAGLLLAGRIK